MPTLIARVSERIEKGYHLNSLGEFQDIGTINTLCATADAARERMEALFKMGEQAGADIVLVSDSPYNTIWDVVLIGGRTYRKGRLSYNNPAPVEVA
jgi:hypothetical protein